MTNRHVGQMCRKQELGHKAKCHEHSQIRCIPGFSAGEALGLVAV